VPFLPILSILASLWLMLNLATDTWLRFGIWMLVGFVVYFFYSSRNSRLATGEGQSGPPSSGQQSAPQGA
jgi:APA family basic amino acid/polyamine antiporter